MSWQTPPDFPPIDVMVVIKTIHNQYYEAAWSGDFWWSRNWLGFAKPDYVIEWTYRGQDSRIQAASIVESVIPVITDGSRRR